MRGEQRFSVKDQIVNIFGLAGHAVPVVTTQLCLCHLRRAVGNT